MNNNELWANAQIDERFMPMLEQLNAINDDNIESQNAVSLNDDDVESVEFQARIGSHALDKCAQMFFADKSLSMSDEMRDDLVKNCSKVMIKYGAYVDTAMMKYADEFMLATTLFHVAKSYSDTAKQNKIAAFNAENQELNNVN